MPCVGAPFAKRTKHRLSLYNIWQACIMCGCRKCQARLSVEASQYGESPNTLGNVLVKDGFRPRRVRWRGGIEAAVKREIEWLSLSNRLRKRGTFVSPAALRMRFRTLDVARRIYSRRHGDVSPWARQWLIREIRRKSELRSKSTHPSGNP